MPIITISRGTFSGGKDLAECLAKELGYPCISREILVEARESYGASEMSLADALEHAPSFLDRLKRDRDRYLSYIRAVLYRHAEEGDFIYHGYAGHHLLAGIQHMIRVRVVADMSYRINAAMKQLGLTNRQAENHIKKVDDERRSWTRFLYGVSWEDPMSYDVVLNLEHLGVEGASATVIRMNSLEQFQPDADSQKNLKNLLLQNLVLAALARDERTRDAEFRVRVEDGTVTVEGVAKLQQEMESVNQVISGVDGVKKVINQVVGFGIPT